MSVPLSQTVAQRLADLANKVGPNMDYDVMVLNLLELARELEKPKHAVGVSVLLTNQRGHVLLGKRKTGTTAGGLLSTPGGRLELEESVIEGAVREFHEETGARIFPDELTIIDARKHKRFGDQYVMFYVHAGRHEGEIRNTEPDKHDEWAFTSMLDFRPEECTEPTDVLAKLAARIAFGPLLDDASKYLVKEIFAAHD